MAKMRLGWYAGASTALAGSSVLWAFYKRANFYSAMVYLSQSYFSKMVIANFALLLYGSLVYSLIRLCFGTLRGAEVEVLTERAWFAITETCLAMTIFRDESGLFFLTMFTMLVTGKIWGWICDGRIEILEQQTPANPRLFHTRLQASLLGSLIFNSMFLNYSIRFVVQSARPSMMVMFGFEFAVLMIRSSRSTARYIMSVIEERIVKAQTKKRLAERKREVQEERQAEIRRRQEAAASGTENPDDAPLPNPDDIEEMDIEVAGWGDKGELLLWLELVADFLKLLIYVAFFFMLLIFYGIPIHIVRDVFLSIRDFFKRLSAVIKYRRAIKEMNGFPDASVADLARENTCIICREEMHPWDAGNSPGALDRVRAKKLPCTHALHLGCLKSWLERQQVCPTCRAPVTSAQPRPLERYGLRPFRQDLRRPEVPPRANQNNNNNNNNNGGQPRLEGNAQPQPNARPQANAQHPRPDDRPALQYNAQQPNRDTQPAATGQAPPTPNQHGPPAAALPMQNLPTDNIEMARSHLQQASELLQREYLQLYRSASDLAGGQRALQEYALLRTRQGASNQQPPQASTGATATQGPTGTSNPAPNMAQRYPGFGNFGNYAGPGSATLPVAQGSVIQLPGIALPYFPPTMARYGTNESTTVIQSGSADLPEGVSIPPGWSLMPLQSLNPAAPPHLDAQGVGSSDAGQRPGAEGASSQERPEGIGSAETPAQTTPDQAEAPPAAQAVEHSPAPAVTEATGPEGTPAQAEPTPVAAPSSAAPNWGGQAQMFGDSQSKPADGTDAAEQSKEADSPQPVPAPEADKGKGKAVTVEDEEADEQT